jgi:hypothetical protein
MLTFIINITLLTLCHFDMFRTARGVRKTYIDNKVKELNFHL